MCLAEANKSTHLDCLVIDAVSISLSCDKRKTRFALRFRASDKHLNVMTGILAVNQHISTVHAPEADSYKLATLQGLLHAATPRINSCPGRINWDVGRLGQ